MLLDFTGFKFRELYTMLNVGELIYLFRFQYQPGAKPRNPVIY
jgi:hypothetical protein